MCRPWSGGSTPRRAPWWPRGPRFLPIDEPFLAGYPEQAALAVEAATIATDGVPASWALHVCYGNRYAALLGGPL